MLGFPARVTEGKRGSRGKKKDKETGSAQGAARLLLTAIHFHHRGGKIGGERWTQTGGRNMSGVKEKKESK